MHPTHRHSLARFVESNGCTQANFTLSQCQTILLVKGKCRDFIMCLQTDYLSMCRPAVFKYLKVSCQLSNVPLHTIPDLDINVVFYTSLGRNRMMCWVSNPSEYIYNLCPNQEQLWKMQHYCRSRSSVEIKLTSQSFATCIVLSPGCILCRSRRGSSMWVWQITILYL
jgi:hypothetical protein